MRRIMRGSERGRALQAKLNGPNFPDMERRPSQDLHISDIEKALGTTMGAERTRVEQYQENE